MIIVNLVEYGCGWDPVNHMVRLAGQTLEAEVIEVPLRRPSPLQRLAAVIRRRQQTGSETESCLVICSNAADLLRVIHVPGLRSRFKFLAAWVIDSFWLEWIPPSVRMAQPFDKIFVTTAEDIDAWRKAMRVPVEWLPWGTDALRLGGHGETRDLDLTRVGRQPPEWDDDATTTKAAAQRAIRFHPRPDGGAMDPFQNQEFLLSIYRRTKYLLAFSNIANPTRYTHPTRQYITGRWVDGLGGGAVIAGVAPREPSIDGMLWPGALLELGGVELRGGMEVIKAALDAWTPAIAAENYRQALRKLDWRWRFKRIADSFEERPTTLADEIVQIERAAT